MAPKNTGLERCRKIAETLIDKSKIKLIRGEDIPFFVEKSIQEDKNIIGITGEDLFKEYILNTRNSKLKILKRIAWEDNLALFKKPVLCILGPKNKTLDEMPKRLRVCINKKYSKLAKKFLSRVQYSKGITFEKLYFSGSTEEVFINNIADLVIDIVYSGKSMKEAGLKIYEKIFESDIVIIGGRNDNSIN